MFNKEIESFESLLKSRLAGVLPVVKKPRKRDYKAYEARRRNDPKRKAYKKKYYLEHAEELKEKRRKYNASSWGKKVNSEYSREYRLRKGEEEKARKRAWYHANKVLKGTPRGPKPKAKRAAENLEQTKQTGVKMVIKEDSEKEILKEISRTLKQINVALMFIYALLLVTILFK